MFMENIVAWDNHQTSDRDTPLYDRIDQIYQQVLMNGPICIYYIQYYNIIVK